MKAMVAQKAFTLIEVLIATTIFAFVMVMTTGVIAQSTSYQSKITAVRDSSQESARISDAIARDIRTATADPFKVTDKDGNSFALKNGIALLNDSGVFGNLTGLAGTAPAYSMRVLVISTKDSVQFYIYDLGQKAVFAKTYKKDSTFATWWPVGANTLKIIGSDGSNILNSIKVEANKISSANQEITDFGFIGFTASDYPTAPNQQSFVSLIVKNRTKNYDSLLASQRAETYLRTMVTVRNYAN